MFLIKRIKFENSNLYISKELEIGDTILLGISGIWKVTYIDKNDYIWCGGLNTHIKKGSIYDKVLKKQFLNWLNNIHMLSYTEGDIVTGLNDRGERLTGIVKDEIYPEISQESVWIRTYDGYTQSINVGTVKRI